MKRFVFVTIMLVAALVGCNKNEVIGVEGGGDTDIPLPPLVSLPIPSEGFKVLAAADCVLAPDFLHSDVEGFSVEWYVDDRLVGTDVAYTFNERELGMYRVRIVAQNSDGSSTEEFDVQVVEAMPRKAEFPTSSLFQGTTDRYTFVGRPVLLYPLLENFEHPVFEWSVNGETVDCRERQYEFTPVAPGEYTVKVTISDEVQHTSEAWTQESSRSAEVRVVCVDVTERQRMRAKTAGSSSYSNEVYEWVPAPGQFIGETTAVGGMTGNESTLVQANAWAKSRLSQRKFVSLGTFGGYIVVGFDHSVEKTSQDYDFAIEGNAFASNQGGSSEPGIVWVMQDVNGNGEPDDEWYELRGSEQDNPETIKNYAVTYFRPAAPGMDVRWVDSEGRSGRVDYLAQHHRQDYYYPAWITTSSYTLRGTRLPSNSVVDPSTGAGINTAYGWGYADNYGSDCLDGGAADGDGRYTGFKISNAVYADGTPIDLKYIDFVKIQTGVLAQSGALGEVSTEVLSVRDFSMANK